MGRVKFTVWMMVLTLALGLSPAGEVWSQESGTMTIRTLVVYQVNAGFERVEPRAWEIYTDGELRETVVTENGHLTVTIPRQGRTVFRLRPVYFHNYWLNLTITFSDPDDFIMTFDNPVLDPIYREIPLIMNDDGTYFFNHRHRELGFFQPQDNLAAPIMGMFRDIQTNNAPARLPEYWDRFQWENGDEYGCIFTYAAPSGQGPALQVTWTYPDGTELVRTYPRPVEMVTEDGIIVTIDTGRRDTFFGDYPFRLRRVFPPEFIQAQPPGSYLLSYRLVDPAGNVSNPMNHQLFIVDPEDWYP